MARGFFRFSRETEARAKGIVSRYPERRSALLPVLWLVQEQEGFVPESAASAVAELVGVSVAEVHEVVSFYTLFNRKPSGMHHIQVCIGPCCRLRDADSILNYLKSVLGIGAGEVSSDGRFCLSSVECLGSCGSAPMMRIDDEYYEDLNLDRVDSILKGFGHKGS